MKKRTENITAIHVSHRLLKSSWKGEKLSTMTDESIGRHRLSWVYKCHFFSIPNVNNRFHGIITLVLVWTRVKSMPDGGQRMLCQHQKLVHFLFPWGCQRTFTSQWELCHCSYRQNIYILINQYFPKGENTLRGQIGPMLPQNIKNILKRTNTPQYNVEVLWLMLAKRNPVSDWSKRFYNDANL